MKKKVLSLLVSGCMITGMLMGCAQKEEAAQVPAVEEESKTESTEESVDVSKEQSDTEEVEITYANFNASGENEETLDKMYQAFHEAYPNITVKIETIGYDDYFTQMQTRVAGGTAPDCYELNIENFAAYANKGVLAELSGIDTSGYNQTALSAFQVDGKQYGVPGNFSNVVLIYNKDLFFNDSFYFESEHEGNCSAPGIVLYSSVDFMGRSESDLEMGIKSAIWDFKSTSGYRRDYRTQLADR